MPFLLAIVSFLGAIFWKRNADGSLFSNFSLKDAVYGPAPLVGPVQVVNQTDLDTLARTVWGEARGEGYRGMQAVANVIMNRYRKASISSAYASRWGKTVAQICKKPLQFSCWNSNDPNRARLLAVTVTDSNFRDALIIAEEAIRGRLPDLTNGADHYHTFAVTPAWSKGQTAVASLGSHQFFAIG